MKQCLLAWFCVLFTCSNLEAQTIYSYTSATNGAPASVDANATGTSLTRVNGLTAPGSPCGTGFSSANFSSTATFSTSLGAVSVTVKPNAGYKLTVTAFSVGIRRSSTGPAFNRLAYSVDGGATWIDKGSNDAPNNAGCGSMATASWNPTDFDVTSTTNGIIFRVFGGQATSTGGTYQIMNLNINGTVSAAIAACADPAGLAANNLTNVSADLSWNAVAGSNGYEYIVDQIAADPLTAGTGTGNTTVNATSLTPSTTYYLHVRTVCGATFSAWKTISFVTLGCYNVTPGIILSSAGNLFCTTGSTNLSLSGHTTGTGIAYQWKSSNDGIIWNNVGTNSATYATGALTDTTYYKAIISCTASGKIDSTEIDTIAVEVPLTPVVSIAAAPGNTICASTPVTFTATASDAGTTPTFAWFKNNIAVGTNSNTYTDNNLSNNDNVLCVVTPGATCTSTPNDTSNGITMIVNAIPVPSATLSLTPNDTICNGTNVTFMVLPVNGGSSPSFQWKKNGLDISGETSVTYSTSGLNNNDKISCMVTSNAVCAAPAVVNSDTVTMTVNAILTPSVSITSGLGNTICEGTPVTYTANATNAGSTPVYKWFKNNTVVGTNSNTYTDNNLGNNDNIFCVVASSAVCTSTPDDTSNVITMTVNPVKVPSASLNVTPNDTICGGTSTTFSVILVNGGIAPQYQWKKNGVTIPGEINATYTTTSLANNDKIFCLVTSNAVCAMPGIVNSDTVTMKVNPVLTPSVTITAAPGNTICAGTNVNFTAVASNPGTTPLYQWKKNGNNVGTNSTAYSDNTLAQGDIITCVLTSSETCVTSTTAISNAVTMTVNVVVVPTIVLSLTPSDTICAGTTVNFTTTVINAGSNPVFEWRRNGNIIGAATGSSYSSSVLADGDVIAVSMLSSTTCASPGTVTDDTTIIVNPLLLPELSIFATPDTNICAGTQVFFGVQTVNAGPNPQYQWKLNGVSMTGATSSIYMLSNLNNGDAIACELTSNATCATPATVNSSNVLTFKVSPTAAPVVTISASPGIVINQGQEVTFSSTVSNSSVSPVYKWYKNGIEIPGATGTTYKTTGLNANDIVYLVVYSSEPCAQPDSGKSNSLQFTVTNNIRNTVTGATDLQVYPNPSNGNFMVEGAGFTGSIKMELIDNLGRIIHEDVLSNSEPSFKRNISMNNVTAGVYYLRFSANGSTTFKRVIISK